MKMATAERWAKSINISTDEFNEYLKKLNYQVWVDEGFDKEKMVWHITEKGRKHGRISRNPFKRIVLWDFDAAFAVVKVKGKVTKEYFYCDECDMYLPMQSGFDFSMQRWVCKRCGHVNKLYYSPEDYV